MQFKKLWMRTRIGLTSLFLLSFATACQTTDRQVVSIIPEATLLEDCVKRPVRLETNGDLAVAYATRDQDVDICNADKAALRAWARTVSRQGE